jgi:hypothetical protein
VLLIFDEVKTGLTAGAHGAAADWALAGPDHAGQVDRRRPATGGLRRNRGSHAGRRRQPDGALRHLQRQPAVHGRGRRRR